jgi:type VI secretion system secreted protein Hcp
LKSAILTARKAGKDQQEYLKITLSDVLVSSYQHLGAKSGDTSEAITFAFAKIEKEYKEQKADGTLGGAVKAGWHLAAHKKV